MKRRNNSLRLESYNYSNSGAYFITICSYKREEIFGEIENDLMNLNNAGEIINECWHQIPEKYENIKLDDFVIMPNHIHGIIWIVGAIHESPETKQTIHQTLESKPAIHNLSEENFKSQQNNGVIRELPLRIERRKMLLSKIIGRDERCRTTNNI